jgi:hypothetical protein
MTSEIVDSWGWFSEREMSRSEGEETLKETTFWTSVTEEAKKHGGLRNYLNFLGSEKEEVKRIFSEAVDLVVEYFTTKESYYRWENSGGYLWAYDPYGNVYDSWSHNSLRRNSELRSMTLVEIIEKDMKDKELYDGEY